MTKVLVTGSRGFIGKALVERLHAANVETLSFDGRVQNIRDYDPYLDQGIDHVVHLAAKTFVPESWTNPLDFYETNVLGTLGVLGFCESTGATLTFASSYLYGIPDKLPIEETARLDPTNPYALSKLAAEDACRFFAKAKNIGVTIIRPFNIYGPGQPDKFLVPSLIKQALDISVDHIDVHDLTPKRDYIHIDDLVELFKDSVVHKPLSGSCEAYNAGTGTSYSVSEVIDIIQRVAGTTKAINSSSSVRPGEIQNTQADCQKAGQDFGWSARIDLISGIQDTIDSLRLQHP